MSCFAGLLQGGTAPKARTYANITETIGGTPVVRVNKLAPEGVELYVKLEYFNPLSSVKDLGLRMASGRVLEVSIGAPDCSWR